MMKNSIDTMENSNFFNSVVEWIADNKGYSFLLQPSAQLLHYTDAHGIKRPLVYHGASDEIKMLEALKEYVNWRLTQAGNYAEITFAGREGEYEIIRINLKEESYEKTV